MTDGPFLTTDEVLEYLHLNLKTVYRLIKAGKLPAVRVGRQWRFRKEDIDAWLETGSQGSADTGAAAERASVLVVDDEESVRDLIATTLSTAGQYDVMVAANAPSALVMLRARVFDLLVTDLKMPGMDGLAMLREVRLLKPDLPVVILTAVPSEASAIEAINLGVSGYVTKPFRVQQILETVARALGSRKPPAAAPIARG